MKVLSYTLLAVGLLCLIVWALGEFGPFALWSTSNGSQGTGYVIGTEARGGIWGVFLVEFLLTGLGVIFVGKTRNR